jgi:hypothetical protein
LDDATIVEEDHRIVCWRAEPAAAILPSKNHRNLPLTLALDMSASYDRLLRWLLRFCGVMMLLALPAVFFSIAAMDAVHQKLGLGKLPEGPIVLYLARALSVFYAGFGMLTLLISSDTERYRPIITWWGVVSIALGGLLVGIEWSAGLPGPWMIGEFLASVVAGAAVLWLQRASRG